MWRSPAGPGPMAVNPAQVNHHFPTLQVKHSASDCFTTKHNSYCIYTKASFMGSGSQWGRADAFMLCLRLPTCTISYFIILVPGSATKETHWFLPSGANASALLLCGMPCRFAKRNLMLREGEKKTSWAPAEVARRGAVDGGAQKKDSWESEVVEERGSSNTHSVSLSVSHSNIQSFIMQSCGAHSGIHSFSCKSACPIATI